MGKAGSRNVRFLQWQRVQEHVDVDSDFDSKLAYCPSDSESRPHLLSINSRPDPHSRHVDVDSDFDSDFLGASSVILCSTEGHAVPRTRYTGGLDWLKGGV